MNGSVVYVDSSAFVKTVLAESESEALQTFLNRCDRVTSSALLETEARRAALRNSEHRLALLERRLEHVALIAITRDILLSAGLLRPAGIRSLDAIHLATALAIADDLHCLVTYDERMREAGLGLGLSVESPR